MITFQHNILFTVLRRCYSYLAYHTDCTCSVTNYLPINSVAGSIVQISIAISYNGVKPVCTFENGLPGSIQFTCFELTVCGQSKTLLHSVAMVND